MQLVKGFPRIELGKYLFWYVLPQAVDFIEIAALAVFVQSIVPHKFWGWGLMVLYGLSTLVFGALGLEHNLYNYASHQRACR